MEPFIIIFLFELFIFLQNAIGKYSIDSVAVSIAMVCRYVNFFHVFQMRSFKGGIYW